MGEQSPTGRNEMTITPVEPPATPPVATPPAPPPATPVEPPITPPVTPAKPEFNFPADTPIVDMTAEQQTEYWREKAQKHEKLWQSVSAKSPADIAAVLAKAKRFDEFEEASKTELQKAADRATAAEAKFAEIEARAMRAEVAAAKGIPATLLSGTTQEELEASADALIAFKGTAVKPDFGAGDRGNDVGAKKQMTLSEMQALYASKDYAAIETARVDGRLTTVLGG